MVDILDTTLAVIVILGIAVCFGYTVYKQCTRAEREDFMLDNPV